MVFMYWKCLYFQDKKEQGQVLPSCTSPSYIVRALGVFFSMEHL
jgi:hypothetical protein